MLPMTLIALVAVLVTVVLAFGLARSSRAQQLLRATLLHVEAESKKARAAAESVQERFASVLDIEAEARKARVAAERAQTDAASDLERTQAQIEALRSQYATGLARYEELTKAVSSLEESLDSIDVGLYEPHFTYFDTEAYKNAIDDVRSRQKALIKEGRACSCGKPWAVDGDRREGERMVKQNERLILRAFNAESEAAVANVSWNNLTVMTARIEKAFEALNKQGTVLDIRLSEEYKRARLEELRLTFEAAEKHNQEREEQRRQRAEQREEEKAQRELLREQERASEDEAMHQKALDKARRELQDAQASERAAMEARIHQLEADLASAQDRKQRAIAQAQLTKVGHVYIISNIGAFGEGVVKIGLTRRLDPEERVHELGDAAVPFPFDTHAMIYSENAVELESRLHKVFWEHRLNWANDRKEFFAVTLDDIEGQLEKLGVPTPLARIPEAKEWRRTIVARDRRPPGSEPPAEKRFPDDPFSMPASTDSASPGPSSS